MKDNTEPPNQLNGKLPHKSDVESWLSGLREKSESSKKKAKDPKAIQWLFDSFSRAWGAKWDKKYDEDPKGMADDWTDALAGLSRQAIKQGLSKTRQTFVWPPNIAEFLQACQGVAVEIDANKISIAAATDTATALVRKKIPELTKELVFVERAIFTALYSKIYHTQNLLCDFAICAQEGCCNYEIFDSGRVAPWLCVKHERGSK